jgi:hypothetical protein
MNQHRFDALSRFAARVASRRSVLTLLAGLSLDPLELTDAMARKSGKCRPQCSECETCDKGKCRKTNSGKKKCKQGTCEPKAAGTPCTEFPAGICQNGSCHNLMTDQGNCGSLGSACRVNQVCQNGSCFPMSSCPATTTSLCPSTGPGPSCGPGCGCSQSAEGNVLCVQTAPSFCTIIQPSCQTSTNCPQGQACIDISDCCGIPFPPGSKICMERCIAPDAPRDYRNRLDERIARVRERYGFSEDTSKIRSSHETVRSLTSNDGNSASRQLVLALPSV